MPGDKKSKTQEQQDEPIQIDAQGVIDSLQRQLAEKSLEIAKIESHYLKQLRDVADELRKAREVIVAQASGDVPHAKVEHAGRTTKSSKKKKKEKS